MFPACRNGRHAGMFDNLGVTQSPAPYWSLPVGRETHYYPQGLVMSGISTVAPLKIANRFKYQGKELQEEEFADGSGLEWYDFEARYHDPQLGRWWSQDPVGQFGSPYLAMGNHWTNGSDPNGEWFGIDDAIASIVGAVVNVVSNIGNIHGIGSFFGYLGVGALSGEATLYGGPLAGGAVLGLGNNINQQASQNGWANINWGQAAISTGVGALTSYGGAALGKAVTPAISNALSGISSPVLQNAAVQGASGAVVGFGVGTGASLVEGNSIGASLGAGGEGALFGLGAGTISGSVYGLKVSKELGLNPWTGKSNIKVIAPDFSTSKGGGLINRKGVSNGIMKNSDYGTALKEWNNIKANLPPNAKIINNGNAFKVNYSDGSVMIGSFYPKTVNGQIQWNIHTYFSTPTSKLKLYQLKQRFLP